MRLQSTHGREVGLAALAAAQSGVVARRQLAALGFPNAAISRRVRARRLIRQYRGVYAVGHEALRPEGNRLAAVLACGADGCLIDRSAGMHWGTWSWSGTSIEVGVPRGGGRGPAGVRTRSVQLRADERTVLDGIPVTTLARTTVDLVAALPDRLAPQIVDAAIHHEAFDRRDLDAQLARPRPGVALTRAIVARLHPAEHLTRSEFERRALRLVDDHGLPPPSVKVWLPDPGCDVDLLWADQRVAVLVDGWQFHAGRAAFERDREVAVELQARGYTALRFTWRQMDGRPSWMAGHIAQALRRGGRVPRRGSRG